MRQRQFAGQFALLLDFFDAGSDQLATCLFLRVVSFPQPVALGFPAIFGGDKLPPHGHGFTVFDASQRFLQTELTCQCRSELLEQPAARLGQPPNRLLQIHRPRRRSIACSRLQRAVEQIVNA